MACLCVCVCPTRGPAKCGATSARPETSSNDLHRPVWNCAAVPHSHSHRAYSVHAAAVPPYPCTTYMYMAGRGGVCTRLGHQPHVEQRNRVRAHSELASVFGLCCSSMHGERLCAYTRFCVYACRIWCARRCVCVCVYWSGLAYSKCFQCST